eukprot:SM000199S05404  [mRNA]  locus=s199:41474:42936:- [translate_table: standard]
MAGRSGCGGGDASCTPASGGGGPEAAAPCRLGSATSRHPCCLPGPPGDAAPGLADVVCEFLEVAVHQILCVRGVYPAVAAAAVASRHAEVFERRRHYGVPVHWARHPDLEEYVRSVATSLRDWIEQRRQGLPLHPIEQGTVEKFALVIHHGSARVALERHVVSLQLDAATPGGSIPEPRELEPALRAFLLKLAVLDAPLIPLPPDCSFEVIAYTKKLPDGVGGAVSDVVWIPAEGGELSDLQVLPVKSLRSGILNIQMYVEQPTSGTNAKADLGT